MENTYTLLLAELGINAQDLEIQAGLGKGVISKSKSRKTNPSIESLLKIKAAFPGATDFIDKVISKMTKAEMNLSETSAVEESAPEYNRPSKEKRLETARAALNSTASKSHDPQQANGLLKFLPAEEPLPESIPITEDVFAGGDSGFDDLYPQIIGYMQSPELKGCTRAVYQNGDSMEPVFSSGDMLGIEDLPPNSSIMSGYIYAISYERYSVVKRLRKSKKGDDYIRLCSDNPAYDEHEISRSEIIRLAIVRVRLPFSKIERFY